MADMRSLVPCLAAAALVAAACDKTGPPVPVPITIATPTITETFTGTLATLGSNLHNFQVTQPSEIDVTLTTETTVANPGDPTTDPPTPAVPAVPVAYPVNVRVGQPVISTLIVTCSSLKAIDTTAGSAPQLTGQALAGTFCVSVSDPTGALPQSITYVVTVRHS
jgi:hypothetical protein